MIYLKRMWAVVCCAAMLLAFSALVAGHDGAAQRRRGAKRRTGGRKVEGRVTEGAWGGAHLRLEVRGDGAALEFDCAHGQIDAPFEVDAEGRCDLRGTYTREGPGPIRLGREPTARPARYVG